MIKVLHIQETIGSGGVERRRLSLAKYLDSSKYELKIICTKTDGNIADEIRSNGVEVITIGLLNTPFDFSQHKKVLKIIDDFKPHIIHGAVFEGVTMASINGFLKQVPIVIIEETSDPQNRTWKGHLLMKFFSIISDKVIGVSPAATEYLNQKLGISKNKVKLINNGIATPRIVQVFEQLELKKTLAIYPDEIVIGSVGRMLMDSHKRFSDLINAFALVLKKGINAKLILVGEGPERLKYEQQVQDLEITDKVIFVGYQPDVTKYYSIFDVFTLVSAYEAFGLVLAEAMLNKLPIVATRVGGMKYIVEDNKTGFLIEKYNVHEIANKLELLCNDINLRKIFGENGYERAMKNYTEERYVKDIENLYLELIKQKKLKI